MKERDALLIAVIVNVCNVNMLKLDSAVFGKILMPL